MQAAEQLQASEQQYRLLFRNNPHPMWVYDAETLRFLAVNDAAISHYGYTEDEFLAMTLRDIRPQEDVDALERSVALHTPRKDHGVWRHCKKDGTLIDVEISSDTIEFDGLPVRARCLPTMSPLGCGQRSKCATSGAARQSPRCNHGLRPRSPYRRSESWRRTARLVGAWSRSGYANRKVLLYRKLRQLPPGAPTTPSHR